MMQTTRIPTCIMTGNPGEGPTRMPIRIRRFVLPSGLPVWEELINRPDIRVLGEYFLGESVFVKYAINGVHK